MALLQPDTARIGHPPGQPAEDRFPEELASGTPRELREALSKLVGANQVLYRAIDLVRYASDASPYRLIPQVVVAPRTVDDVVDGARSDDDLRNEAIRAGIGCVADKVDSPVQNLVRADQLTQRLA